MRSLRQQRLCTYLDIKELLCEHRRSLIDWVTRSIEHSSQHFDTHWHSQDVTGELTCGSEVIDVGGSFEDLQTKVRRERWGGLTWTTACFPLISRT